MDSAKLLKFFGYTTDWLELEVVTDAILRQQLDEYERSDDKNLEHYRYRSFSSYLNKLNDMPNILLDDLLALTDEEADGVDLRENRAFDLLHSGLLADQQIDYLRDRSELAERKSFQKAAYREQLLRRIRIAGISQELFSELQEFNDAILLRHTLEHEHLDQIQLEWIAGNGSNRAVRNMANQALRRRK